MKLVLNGAAGRMGQMLAQRCADGFLPGAELAALVDTAFPPEAEAPRYHALSQYQGAADVVLDFSNHAAAEALLDYCVSRRLPVVVASTGHTQSEKEKIRQAAEEIPVFLSANMSIGVAVLARLAREAVAVFPQADVEIVEIHHNQKLDVPSGTALMLAEELRSVREQAVLLVGRHENGKRTAEEIGIHSLRLGNEVGIHEILISTGNETLTLKHQAVSRALFADGALTAAAFLAGKPAGLYTMKDILA